MQNKLLVSLLTLAFISGILIFFITNSNESENGTHQTQTISIIDHNTNSSETGTAKINNTNKINNENSLSGTSKLSDNCLDELKSTNLKLTQHNLTKNNHHKTSALLNTCVYEIDMELALTENQIIRSPETMQCFNKIYEIRDSLMQLGVDAQRFSELPNETDSDRAIILEAFTEIYNSIKLSSESAMTNRTIYCQR